MLPQRLERLVSGLPTKSAKIRKLADAGVPRADIARFLGLRYQHVRNVLIDYENKRLPAPTVGQPHNGERVEVEASGKAVLSAALTSAAGMKPGECVLAKASNGVIEIVSVDEAVRRVQANVRRYVPEGRSLVDELLADRRAEVQQDRNGG
jgi:hypothetical protein